MISRSCISCNRSSCHQHVPGIFHGRKEPLTNEEVVDVIASQESRDLYSSIQVRRVSCNVSFLISTENLSPSDAAVDAMGVWSLTKTEPKTCRGQMVMRRTYINKACKDLIKEVVEPVERQFPYVFIQYRFEGEPCSFDLLSQGNSKTSQSPDVRVDPSTMQLLKEETDSVTSARKAYHHVERKVGGLTGASAVSQLPPNTKLAYNMKSREPTSMGINYARPQAEVMDLKAKGMSQVDGLAALGFSKPMINGLKQKAQQLIAGDLVTRAYPEGQSRFVESYSSSKPHLVQPHKQLGFKCDDSCQQYKANKVCAHTVAAAYDNNKLEEHVKLLMRAIPKGSLDALCTGKTDARKEGSHKHTRAKRRSAAQGSEDPKRASAYPWCESRHPFVITRKQKRRVRKCPGCRKEFDVCPPEMDLIVVHRETDWQEGTDKDTPVDRLRGYHLNLTCIRARHPDFLRNPQNSELLMDFDPNKDEEGLILEALELDTLPLSE